ncbi:MAG: hypothetical protein KGD64_15015 [Candidatus Heimdallarchaeota archaeon]|nr:hypothetical protein [Candidatus Heimdallarchaeota archaeon]
MSERDVKYYRQLSKQFEIKEKLFDEKEDYYELEGAKASYQQRQASDKASHSEQMIKVNKLKEEGKADKALKLEVKVKKKEAEIAKYKQTISNIQKKIDKKKLDVRKIEDELEKMESQLRTDFADKFTQM